MAGPAYRPGNQKLAFSPHRYSNAEVSVRFNWGNQAANFIDRMAKPRSMLATQVVIGAGSNDSDETQVMWPPPVTKKPPARRDPGVEFAVSDGAHASDERRLADSS